MKHFCILLIILLQSKFSIGQIDELKPVIDQNDTSQVNWAEHYFEAKGWGVIDTNIYKNKAQAKLMAQRGAITDAQRNLLSTIMGVNIVGETTVKDCVATNDYIYARLEGLLVGARQIGEPVYKDGMCEVTMRVGMYNPPDNKKESVVDVLRDRDYDPKGSKDYKPQLFTQITDSQNNELYNNQKDSNSKALKYYQATDAAINKLKGGEIPLIEINEMTNGALTVPADQDEEVGKWKKVGKAIFKYGKFLIALI